MELSDTTLRDQHLALPAGTVISERDCAASKFGDTLDWTTLQQPAGFFDVRPEFGDFRGTRHKLVEFGSGVLVHRGEPFMRKHDWVLPQSVLRRARRRIPQWQNHVEFSLEVTMSVT